MKMLPGVAFQTLVKQRDAAGDRVTRFFLLPVDRQG